MPVGNLGPDDVVTAAPDTRVSEAIETIETEQVGALVVTEGDEPVGIVTDRDLALAIPDVDGIESESIRSIMTEDPVTLHEDEPAMEISRTIDEHDVRRIPIVDGDGELSGIVTLDDLVATIGEQLDNVADTIEVQSSDYRP